VWGLGSYIRLHLDESKSCHVLLVLDLFAAFPCFTISLYQNGLEVVVCGRSKVDAVVVKTAIHQMY